jgi:hypothetical protein
MSRRCVPVYELAESDFARDPVWQFVSESVGEEGIDESYAEPAPNGLSLGGSGSFMVGARYLLTDRRELPGAVQVDILGRYASFTPTFLYVQGRPVDPLSVDVATRIARITHGTQSPPVRWCLDAKFAGEVDPRSGRISRSRLIRGIGILARLVRLRIMRNV